MRLENTDTGWFVQTNDGDYDADGPTPLEAAARLVDVLSDALAEK